MNIMKWNVNTLALPGPVLAFVKSARNSVSSLQFAAPVPRRFSGFQLLLPQDFTPVRSKFLLVILPSVFAAATFSFAEEPRRIATASGPAYVGTSTSDLPDAPGRVSDLGQATPVAATVPQEGTASISGVVLDINDGIVPGAHVSIAAPGVAERTVESDSSGEFLFGDLPPGIFHVTIAARGLETLVSTAIHLANGEHYQLPHMGLPIASSVASVQVTITEEQLATEQIKAAEKQRVFGVLPNFYTSYIWDAAPLNRKQKFHLAIKSTTDPIAFASAAIVAGAEQAHNTFPAYGSGPAAYGKRFGAAYGDAFIGRIIGSAILPSIFHDDPRYFYRGSGTVWSRVGYAASRAVISRRDSGRWRPNYSHVLGAFAAGGISNLYHPADDRGAKLVLRNGLINTGAHAVTNVIREFVSRKITPNIPDYERGKPAEVSRP